MWFDFEASWRVALCYKFATTSAIYLSLFELQTYAKRLIGRGSRRCHLDNGDRLIGPATRGSEMEQQQTRSPSIRRSVGACQVHSDKNKMDTERLWPCALSMAYLLPISGCVG